MIYTLDHRIGYCEVDQYFRFQLGALFRLFHEATAEHSKLLGADMRDQQRLGYAWAVRKIALRILRFPEYDEQIRVSTWIHEMNKLTMYREFELTVNGQKIAEASSEWFCLDLRRRKISRKHPPLNENFIVKRTQSVNRKLQGWSSPRNITTDNNIEIRIRPSDLDTNRHVNNATYFDYLETLLVLEKQTIPVPLDICIQFTMEISPDIPAVKVGIHQSEGNQYFKIYDHDSIYALGEILISDAEYLEALQ